MGAARRERARKEATFLEDVRNVLENLALEIADIKAAIRVADDKYEKEFLPPPPPPPCVFTYGRDFLLSFRNRRNSVKDGSVSMKLPQTCCIDHSGNRIVPSVDEFVEVPELRVVDENVELPQAEKMENIIVSSVQRLERKLDIVMKFWCPTDFDWNRGNCTTDMSQLDAGGLWEALETELRFPFVGNSNLNAGASVFVPSAQRVESDELLNLRDCSGGKVSEVQVVHKIVAPNPTTDVDDLNIKSSSGLLFASMEMPYAKIGDATGSVYSERVSLKGRFELLPSVGTWIRPLCDGVAGKHTNASGDATTLEASIQSEVEFTGKDQMWYDEDDARWWWRGQVICYFCGEPECRNEEGLCCERRRREILKIEDPSESDSDCISQDSALQTESVTCAVTAAGGYASHKKSPSHISVSDSYRLDGKSVGDRALFLKAKETLHLRVDYMIQFIECNHNVGEPMQVRIVSNMLNKIRETQMWAKDAMSATEINQNIEYLDAYMTQAVKHFK